MPLSSPYSTSYATNWGFGVGDSLMGSGWDVFLRNYTAPFANFKTGGRGWTGSSPTIVETWAAQWPGRNPNTDWVILQGGVNDINNFGSTVAQMKTAFQPILDEATTDVGSGRILVWNISPWSGYASWSTADQAMTEEWNTWLAGKAALGEFILIDMYDVLGDPGDATALNSAYDSGDGLHPNAAGAWAQYEAVMSVLLANNMLDMEERVHTTKRSVGAVQPSTFNSSGNEIRTWVGAVNPLYADTSILQNQTVGANYTWDRSGYGLVLLDRNLTTQEETDLQSSLQAKAGL